MNKKILERVIMITKRKVVLDYDDTIIKSRERIVELLNEKNGTNKSVKDIVTWDYKSIDENITPDEINALYASEKFFNELELYETVKEFIHEMKNKYTFVVCSVGSKENLERKENHIKQLAKELDADIHFAGVEFNAASTSKHQKSCYNFSDCECAIDDNTDALLSTNAKIKILFKPNIEREWNRIPRSSENFYVVSSFEEILEIFKFNEKLKEEGIELGTL